MKKKTKVGLIASALILASAAVITGAVVGTLVSNQKKRDLAKQKQDTNNNNNNQGENNQGNTNEGNANEKEKVFEPTLDLVSFGYNEIKLRVGMLNPTDFLGKEVKVVLVNKQLPSTQKFEQTYKIQKDEVEFTFDNLNDGETYKAEVYFESTVKVSKEFSTKPRPRISPVDQTSTSAVLNLSNLNELSSEELAKIELVIENKTDPSKPPIVIKASDLNVAGGRARVDLGKLELGLEPGTNYEAVVKFKEYDEKTTDLSTPITIQTPQAANVAYTYNAKTAPKKITIYGLKDNTKKLVLEYKPFGISSASVKSVTSAVNPTNGSVVVDFTEDLGFDNHYEFQVKYEGTNEFLTFENQTTKGDFRTEPAPRINVSNTDDGLSIKLDDVSSNIDEDKLFIRYKDKDSTE